VDQAKLDEIARQLSGSTQRRAIVKTGAAATLGALVGVLGLRSGEAARRGGKGDFCERNRDCRSNRCGGNGKCNCSQTGDQCNKNNDCCGNGEACKGGKCKAKDA
jgi:hypothetical protein